MSELVIAKLGACSALGTEASGIQAELAAGMSAFEHQLGPRGAVTVAALELLPVELSQLKRRQALLEHALDDMFEDLSLPANRAALVLAAASKDDSETLAEPLVQRLRAAGIELLPLHIRDHGRASWFAALLLAQELLAEDTCDIAFVFASDSRCDRASVTILAHANELLGEDNRDGLVPGEGACVALCCRPDSPLAKLPTAMCCETVATGYEPHPFVGSQPNLSEGLARVFRALTHAAPAVDIVIDCQTGQARFTKEFHAAYLRCGPLMPEPLVRTSTAATIGEAGVATAGLAMVVAQLELAMRDRALVYASDDEGRLGAAIVTRVGGFTALRERLDHLRSRRPGRRSPYHSRAELLDDHLETCGYLQIDRADDLESAGVPWYELDVVEARIQAQLDALALGGAATIDCARSGFESTSADCRQGSVLVAGSWFAAGELASEVADVAEALDDMDLRELGAALVIATHAGPIITALMTQTSHRLRSLGLELAATCPDISTTDIAVCLSDPDANVRNLAAMSLARRGARDYIGQLLAAADADPASFGPPAALVWLGHQRAVDRLRWLLWQRPEHAVESARWLTMCGTPDDQHAIHQRLTTLVPTVAISDVLGVAGLPTSLPYLLDAVDSGDEQVRIAAARALDRITGAGLRERVVDDHGLLEIRRLLDAERWREWLDQRGAWPTGRLRRGHPWSLRNVWEELCSDSERALRQLAADELSLRGPVRMHLDVRSPIATQRHVLARWAASLNFAFDRQE